jgi:plasmid stabilization system protein ParE
MPTAVWAPKAEQDLEGIIYYLRVTAERPLTAQRIAEEIVAIVDEQAGMVDSGARHPATLPSWRYVRHKRWLIFYKPHSEGIEVTRVIDGSRDLPKALADFSK